MLSDRNTLPIIAVSDLDRARTFYRDTLGLDIAHDDPEDKEMLVFRTGATWLTVYRSEFAGTNKANAVVWEMKGDLAATVAALRRKGVAFERYEFEGFTFRDGIHEAGEVKLAWFKDPDGNILHLVEGM